MIDGDPNFPGEEYTWKRVWKFCVHTQDAGRVWCDYVWRTHTGDIPGAYLGGGIDIYRYGKLAQSDRVMRIVMLVLMLTLSAIGGVYFGFAKLLFGRD